MRYKANPVLVDAFVITHVQVPPPDPWPDSLTLKLDSGAFVTADAGMLARYHPVPGDYWVIQADGYTYINPKAVFERKYSLASDCTAETHKAVLASVRWARDAANLPATLRCPYCNGILRIELPEEPCSVENA